MISRKVKSKNKDISKQAKLLVGTLFLSIGIGSSVHIAFADQDIQSMLINWFEKQRTGSIEQIESAVMTEKEEQLKRLKVELQLEVTKAKQQLNAFTTEEKNKRVKAIQDYADVLIQNISIDNTDEQAKITNELDTILSEAINKMGNVNKKESPMQHVEEPIEDESEIIEQPVEAPSQTTEEPTKKEDQ